MDTWDPPEPDVEIAELEMTCHWGSGSHVPCFRGALVMVTTSIWGEWEREDRKLLSLLCTFNPGSTPSEVLSYFSTCVPVSMVPPPTYNTHLECRSQGVVRLPLPSPATHSLSQRLPHWCCNLLHAWCPSLLVLVSLLPQIWRFFHLSPWIPKSKIRKDPLRCWHCVTVG